MACFAAFLAAGSGLELGLWRARAVGVPTLLTLALLVVPAAFGTVWLERVRAARRCNTAVDAYAERELVRSRRVSAR